MKRLAAVTGILFFIASFQVYAESPRFVINSGHTGAVSAIEYLDSEKLIFSAGFDGSVKAWNINSGKLIHQMHISHMPIRRLAVCEIEPVIAAVESDGINAFRLSVWNWKTDEMLFRQNLKENPSVHTIFTQRNFSYIRKDGLEQPCFPRCGKRYPAAVYP